MSQIADDLAYEDGRLGFCIARRLGKDGVFARHGRMAYQNTEGRFVRLAIGLESTRYQHDHRSHTSIRFLLYNTGTLIVRSYSPPKPSSNAVKPPIPINVPTAALFPCFFFLSVSLSYLLLDFDLRLLRSPLPESDAVESSSYLPIDRGMEYDWRVGDCGPCGNI